ncbi:OprD family porin [Pseudomonas typographi]|uniref:OprD family porin n=1 Tax=Pseudomonas typographi TaxID=2715964 RepID=A0ABR7Z9H3_9PSED|nr:OprD family porin [Pseudomonas typographi]MBD1602216.1 OprD family porin [Pseudomonas typographi]
MRVIKWMTLSLATSAAVGGQWAQASEQSEASGFLEGSKLNVLERNFYINRDFRSGNSPVDNKGESTPYGEIWANGLIGNFQSGFTQGTVGFGVDAIALMGVTLDSGPGRIGGVYTVPVQDNGKPVDEFSSLGVAAKMRISNTVLKVGDQVMTLPVIATDDTRIVPETARGFFVTSNEIDGLTLHAGKFDSIKGQQYANHDSVGLKEAVFAGGAYDFNKNLNGALYYSNLDDVFRKYYGSLGYNLSTGEDSSLATNFNLYRTQYDSKYTGTGSSEDNTIWSGAVAYSLGAHKFTIAYQKSNGGYLSPTGRPVGYVYGPDGGSSIFLSNSIQYSDFNNKDEASWQLAYNLNFASLGVPGLTFGARFVDGQKIDMGSGSDASERETDLDVKYVMQGGAAKDLSVRVRQAFYRSTDELNGDVNDFRVIVEYPISIL